MNGQKAKRLRREAHARSVGKPWTAYGWINSRGKQERVQLASNCGRAIYKELKRESQKTA